MPGVSSLVRALSFLETRTLEFSSGEENISLLARPMRHGNLEMIQTGQYT